MRLALGDLLDRVVAPTTDVGVAVQIVVVLGLLAGAAWSLRGRREWWLVLAGAGLLFLGVVGLRAAH